MDKEVCSCRAITKHIDPPSTTSWIARGCGNQISFPFIILRMFYERMFYEMSITDEKVLRLRNEKRLVEEDGDLETEVKGRLIGAGV